MIAQTIGQIARGRHGSVHLDAERAQQVFLRLLADDADPLQLGAFLIAERMKGETSEELVGFVRAARQIAGIASEPVRQGWVDLPCYAGKRRAAPAHLVAALRLRQQGLRLLVHGVAAIDGRCSAWQCLKQAGVQRAANIDQALALVENNGLAYLDLAEYCPPLMRIYALRQRLGVRSFANSVARLLNPLQCTGQLNGVFHPPYVQRLAEVNAHLGQRQSLIFMGAEGEPELYAHRQKQCVRQQGEAIVNVRFDDCSPMPYPRDVLDTTTVQQQFIAMLEGHASEEEEQRIARSMQALRQMAEAL